MLLSYPLLCALESLSITILIVACLLLSLASCTPSHNKSLSFDHFSSTTHVQPNIILILTDDQDLLLNSLDYMPLLKKYLTEQGATFPNYFIPTPVCCPSRASILRGQYAHNTQIIDLAEPGGGGERFHALGLENSTIATWLQDAGYRTALHGKYLNQYPCNNSWIPPGWDDWFALCTPQIYNYIDSNYNENGVIRNVLDYQSDTIGMRAQQFIEKSHSLGVPFFVHLSFIAPHTPARPAEKYRNMFQDVKLPRTRSYNQKDVTYMPSFISSLPRLNETFATIQEKHYRKRLQSLQSVDEYVEQIVLKLESLNMLQHTYIVYTSDNGYHIGQHRLIQGKRMPYEEDIRVPFIIRGPGIPRNISVPINTLNIDIAPTFAELAKANIPSFVDGKSILPFLGHRNKSEQVVNSFRPFILLEHWGLAAGGYQNNTWQGLRIHNATCDMLYTSWCSENHEFYNISADPYQTENRYGYDFNKMHEHDSVLRQMFFCRASECNHVFEPLPLVEFVPTPLTPCFNGRKDSVLPSFRTANKHPVDYTYEEVAKDAELEEEDLVEARVDFSYFSMTIMVLFVLFGVFVCFVFRRKLATYNSENQQRAFEVHAEYQREGKHGRKRLAV